MTRSTMRLAGRCAVVLSIAMLVSCAGADDVLGPPDGAACTRGVIAPGDSVKGEITAASCVMFSDRSNAWVRAESWTLNAAANSAYIVRLRHVPNGDAVDNWSGTFYAYARNPQGDPVFGTGPWDTFGSNNGNGGRNFELFLTTDTDRTLSLRVQVSALAGTGAYTLSVERCALHTIPDSAALDGIDITTGCISRSWAARPVRLSFFGFAADTSRSYHAIGTRSGGNGSISADVSGPDLDVGCWTALCTSTPQPVGATSFDIDLGGAILMPGRQTLMVNVDADSTATVSVHTTSAAITAPSFRARRGPHTR